MVSEHHPSCLDPGQRGMEPNHHTSYRPDPVVLTIRRIITPNPPHSHMYHCPPALPLPPSNDSLNFIPSFFPSLPPLTHSLTPSFSLHHLLNPPSSLPILSQPLTLPSLNQTLTPSPLTASTPHSHTPHCFSPSPPHSLTLRSTKEVSLQLAQRTLSFPGAIAPHGFLQYT